MDAQSYKLLSPKDPSPVMLHHAEGGSDFVITCDHAGNLIPEKLGSMGLSPLDLARHIGWDVGASGLSRRLSLLIDAPLVTQTYSRLVIDCNRGPGHPTSIAPRSEATDVPANQDLAPDDREAREREIFWPYHETIARLLDERQAAGRRTILICMHSFTPVYHGEQRPWHVGLLYNRDRRMADILHDLLAEDPDLCIGDNQPYAVSDESDYGVPVHGERRGLPHIEIEMRHDLIETVAHQQAWAERWAELLVRADERLSAAPV